MSRCRSGTLTRALDDSSCVYYSIGESKSVALLSRAYSRSLSAVEVAEQRASLDHNQQPTFAVEIIRSRNARE